MMSHQRITMAIIPPRMMTVIMELLIQVKVVQSVASAQPVVVKAVSVFIRRRIGPTFSCIVLLNVLEKYLEKPEHANEFCDEFVVESEAYEFVNSKPICVYFITLFLFIFVR